MTKKICPCTGCPAHTGSCPNIVDKGRCQRCARETRQARGNDGYGWQHQKRRARLFEQALGAPCPDCGNTLTAGNMVADHTTPLSEDPTSIATRVHCRRCSDKQGGKLSQRYR